MSRLNYSRPQLRLMDNIRREFAVENRIGRSKDEGPSQRRQPMPQLPSWLEGLLSDLFEAYGAYQVAYGEFLESMAPGKKSKARRPKRMTERMDAAKDRLKPLWTQIFTRAAEEDNLVELLSWVIWLGEYLRSIDPDEGSFMFDHFMDTGASQILDHLREYYEELESGGA